MRRPTPAEALAAYHYRAEAQRKRDARERKTLTLLFDGWSPFSIRRGPDGPVGAWKERPPGLPNHLSDRKSKRVRKKHVVSSFFGRYYSA